MYLGNQTLLVNDALNLLRGKLVRFILEDGDMRMIANLVRTADELGLEYDQESMVYRDRKAEEARSKGRAQLAKEAKRGRPTVEKKAAFRNVAVPMEIYEMIRELSKSEDRTIARQLAVLIKDAYQQTREKSA